MKVKENIECKFLIGEAGAFRLRRRLRRTRGNQLQAYSDGAEPFSTYTNNHPYDLKDYAVLPVEYEWNQNGAMTKDLNKGISAIQYNYLNLPNQIDIKSPVAEAREKYTYSATGERLNCYRRWNSNHSTTPIIGSMPTVFNNYDEVVYINNKEFDVYNDPLNIHFAGGYYSYQDNKDYIYIKDHQGNIRVVADLNGSVVQRSDYYPFGMIAMGCTNQDKQPYKYNGKEFVLQDGLNLYNYGARWYDPARIQFTTMDPLAEKYPGISPYAYCLNNPVRFVDPDGRSTLVKQLYDGTYEIIGGDLDDDDLNIYVYTQDKNGDYTVRGNSIGVTTSITSFYDSYANKGEGGWSMESILNPNDNSGNIFLQGLLDDNPSLVGYMWNATKGEKYDFKATNNTGQVDESLDWYRGMPITNTEFTTDNLPTYSSAKDIGNMAAGYVAATKGLTWKQARAGFDGLQKVQDRNLRSVERPSTQNAQHYGFMRGQRRLMINNFGK